MHSSVAGSGKEEGVGRRVLHNTGLGSGWEVLHPTMVKMVVQRLLCVPGMEVIAPSCRWNWSLSSCLVLVLLKWRRHHVSQAVWARRDRGIGPPRSVLGRSGVQAPRAQPQVGRAYCCVSSPSEVFDKPTGKIALAVGDGEVKRRKGC